MLIDWTCKTHAHDVAVFTKSHFCFLHGEDNGIIFKTLQFESCLHFQAPKTPLSCKWMAKMHNKFLVFSWKWRCVNSSLVNLRFSTDTTDQSTCTGIEQNTLSWLIVHWNRFLSRDKKKTDLETMGVFVQSLWYIHNEFLWGDMTNGLSCGFCANVLDVKYLTELRCWQRRRATGLMTHGRTTERGTLWNDFKVSFSHKASWCVLHNYLHDYILWWIC